MTRLWAAKQLPLYGGMQMGKDITLDELKALAEKIPDGQILRITIRIEAADEGGMDYDAERLSDAGSLDPP